MSCVCSVTINAADPHSAHYYVILSSGSAEKLKISGIDKLSEIQIEHLKDLPHNNADHLFRHAIL